jgi:lysine 6-dehydrogenase
MKKETCKGFRYLVLGAGRMGQAVAYDLARQPGTASVVIADTDAEALRRARKAAESPRVRTAWADAARPASVLPLLKEADAAVSAVPYRFNLRLARSAVAAGAHFCDLGGNDAIVRQELALDRAARARGITIVPDCGLAPGMTSVVVAEGLKAFDRAEAVHIRVGGLPRHPKPPMGYQLVFSVQGLINEYVEPCRALRNARIATLPPMQEVEALTFPAPFGKLEAFTTSGGASTLPDTYRGRIRTLDYKTIRYPGHAAQFRLLMDLGLASSAPRRIAGVALSPRDALADALVRSLPPPGPDAVLIRVTVTGRQGRRRRTLVLQAVEYGNRRFTAMMRTTAFPVAIIAGMLARGEIVAPGAVPQERCVPPARFMAELRRRGIRFTSRWR